MPPNFCLLPQHVDALMEKIKSGELGPDVLAGMTSAERHTAFADIVGESNARSVNAAFETKLLLQNQQKGIETWVKSLTDVKPDVKKDLLARVQRMDRVLEPKELDTFLADLAHQKLGFGVTMEEAGKISELAKAASEARAAIDTGGDRLDYGRAKVEFANYVSALKNGAKTPTAREVVKGLPGLSKSILASLDNSALLRQGWKNLWSHPEIWAKNAKQSFVDMAQQFGGKDVVDAVHADILSRPNALNGRYDRAKLALGNVEEAYPSSLPEKIPGIGRAYKASEAAFTGFQYRMRADVFDKYMQIAERSGVDLNDKTQLESIGKLVNSLTSRGHLGAKLEPSADVLNSVFFSARKLKSDFDFLTAHQLEGGVTPFVRKQAAINLVKVITGTAGVLAVARAVNPKSVETDPRSADFGKIRVGDTRFDVTAGMGSLATLAMRLATMSSKSSTTGKVMPLNTGKFAGRTGADVVSDFFGNKLSPAAGVVRDLLRGKDAQGNKPTIANEAAHAFVPLPLTNLKELHDNPNSANILLATLADALGVSVNTYSAKKTH